MPHPTESILITDSGADQFLAGYVWRRIGITGRHIKLTGPIAGRDSGTVLPVSSVAAKIIDANGKAYCGKAHEVLHDTNPHQHESLLPPAQARAAGNAVDECPSDALTPRGDYGTQCCVISGQTLPLFFDGFKCYYRVEAITDDEMRTLPEILFTSDEEYEPSARSKSRRFPAEEIDWKRTMAFPPDDVLKHTLAATTQLVPTVEAESREIMRDHLKSRLTCLRYRRRRDVDFLDTFKANIKSVRGFLHFNLFSSQRSGYDHPILMQRKSESPETLEAHFDHCGTPHTLKSDNAKEFRSKQFHHKLRKYQLSSKYTEPHHPNQNLAEPRGGRLKHVVQHILLTTGAPPEYWCYCVEYVAFVKARTSKRSLRFRTPWEFQFGGVPDISKCRFSFWQPVWFYTPRGAFPIQRMMKARFLGFSLDSGDDFTYVIVTDPDYDKEPRRIFTRSVIRPRHVREAAPVVVRKGKKKFEIYKKDERTILEGIADPDFPPRLSERAPNPLLTIQEEPEPLDTVEKYERAIEEVYGPPPLKRLRTDPTSDDALLRTDLEEFQPLSVKTVTNSASTLLREQAEPAIQPPRDQEIAAAVPAATVEATPDGPSEPAQRPAPVTQEEQTQGTDQGEHAFESDDDASVQSAGANSVHSADGDLDDHHVTPESLDVHLQNIAGISDDEDLFDSVNGHEFRKGVLFLRILWKTDETSWVPYRACREDFPYETAKYICTNKIGSCSGNHKNGPHQRWARTFLKKTRRVMRRFVKYYGYSKPMKEGQVFRCPEEDDSYQIQYTKRFKKSTPRQNRRAKKPGRLRRPLPVKYGIPIPRTVRQALAIDDENGNHLWRDAMEKEIASLIAMNCFNFHPSDYKPGPNSQFAPLRMIFEAKQDGRRKGRLVCGGHLVDPRGISTRSTVVKGVSVRLLDMIAHRDSLTILHGDVGNAFITAKCLEEIHSTAGPEFGEREGAVVTINKALYGLRSSSRAYRETFAAFMRTIGFEPTRYDRDVWMRLREDESGYDYLCTHVDDFKVVAKDPQRWVNAIAGAFQLKCSGAPDYYLGMDYYFDDDNKVWLTGSKTYVEECIRRIQALLPNGSQLCVHYTPAPSEGPASHPETDTSDFLDDAGKRQYQMLVGMAQWAVTIGRMDIAYAVASLSRFSAAPRQGHLELAFYLFGYLKRFPSKQLPVCSDPLEIHPTLLDKKGDFIPDFLKEYPDAKEDRDPKEPTAYGKPVQTSVFFDANLAHDLQTRRSITGLLVYVGSTLVSWTSKRQGCIASSTYCSEFIAMRAAVEEAMSLRYMLRSLGVPVEEPTNLIGDNLGVIQTASIPEADLKKKHVAISYHCVREAVAAQIVRPIWCDTSENWADICTKALGGVKLNAILSRTML